MTDFVEEMEGGLDAPISQGGSNVSGGQRQRLAIARAIVKNADIYVFDDSFSALDFATDARLRASLSVSGCDLVRRAYSAERLAEIVRRCLADLV